MAKRIKKIPLIIEKATDGSLWGRVTYLDNLIVDQGSSVSALEQSLKRLLYDFHDLAGVSYEFEVLYDMTAFFEVKKYLNISGIAEKAGLNASLMRQYANGAKYPSEHRAKEIEKVVHEVGKELLSVKISCRVNKAQAV